VVVILDNRVQYKNLFEYYVYGYFTLYSSGDFIFSVNFVRNMSRATFAG
jgi:hypothetical protein